jgi:molybdopterin/thiamine biosynthesis adenylyltransferase
MQLHPHLTRQLELIPTDVLGEPITIIGAGAIGSFVALTLAKMGFEDITVYDDDTIEVENMNCQFFRFSDIGKNKANALNELVKDFTGVDISFYPSRYEGDRQLKGIVISAVDSMKARKMIWDAHKDFALGTKLIIDPRMGAEDALCYAMNPMSEKDCASYEKTLYTDEAAVHERCTAKSTMYTALALASHVAKIVKDFLCTDDQNYARVMEWSIRNNFQKTYPAKKAEDK